MENPITPEEQQAMNEWRNSQKGGEKSDTPGVDTAAVEAPAVEAPEASVPSPDASVVPEVLDNSSAPRNESLSQVTQSLEDAQQQLTSAMETGDQVSQQAAEMLTKENIKAAGKDFIDTLRARAKESLQENVEAGKFNLALAKEMAKDAGQKLGEKLMRSFDKAMNANKELGTAGWMAIHLGWLALMVGGLTYNLALEPLAHQQGSLIEGIKQLREISAPGAFDAVALTTGLMGGLSATLAKIEARRDKN